MPLPNSIQSILGIAIYLVLSVLESVVGRARRRGAAPTPVPAEEARISRAFRARRSGVWTGGDGSVHRVLADDLDGDRHQRFVVRLGSGHTVLVAHNIDVAPRAPVDEGSRIGFRGRYEWNDRGGLVHWTHHDPRERRRGGWVEVDGRRYE